MSYTMKKVNQKRVRGLSPNDRIIIETVSTGMEYRVTSICPEHFVMLSSDSSAIKFSLRNCTPHIRYDELGENAIAIEKIYRKTAGKPADVFVENGRIYTRESNYVDAKVKIEVGMQLRYCNEGKDYTVLYISPCNNIIVTKSDGSGLERVIGSKDVKLRNSFGIML